MTTRLRPTVGRTPSISPAFDAGWNQTTGAIRRELTAEAEPASQASNESRTQGETVATSPYDVLLAQFISPPLEGAQTLGDGGATVKGQIKAIEQADDADFCSQCVIRVVSGDGTTFRGTLLAFDTSALSSEWPSNQDTNREFPRNSPAALSSVSAQDGDRIVIEVGYRSHNSLTANRDGRIQIDMGRVNDLAEDETDTGADNPWFEFSEDITFENAVVASTEVVEGAAHDPVRTITSSTEVVDAAAHDPVRTISATTMLVEVAIGEGDPTYLGILGDLGTDQL